ncbi:hypothetical protein C943_01934 [Mariniradius saccharolyticus AK6]|uniref:Uncharacterized protein n=1 Tax=Mariniradius saccharolyticus AK6 TaxID=1239962 RepID=M7XAI3_9BACT|nr:hypothetical protein C943_01934 [Mariniradius saccharolyticus AK6]
MFLAFYLIKENSSSIHLSTGYEKKNRSIYPAGLRAVGIVYE